MPRLIDTHCHLNLPDHFPAPAAEIERARSAGVDRLIVVGIDELTNNRAVELADVHKGVFAIVGWHPNSAASYSTEALRLVEELARHQKTVAIGEIGLDYHWELASREQQERCLIDQLDLAQNLLMPVVFHCREAYPDLLELLTSRGDRRGCLFHCFSGDAESARRAIALDGYFGVDGPITYKKSNELRTIVQNLPRKRIVLETDSPYLSPEPFRGRPNSPANIPIINNALAALLGITADECARITTQNAERFFSRMNP